MNEAYQYRPPIKDLFAGLGGLVMSIIFGLAIVKGDNIGYSIIIGFFSLIMLAVGISFLTLYFRKYKAGNLRLGADFIEIPERWKAPIRLNFDEITNIGEFDIYDQVIEIESKQGTHLIERNWMKQKDFDSIKMKLKEYWLCE